MKKRGLISICFSVILVLGYFYWTEYIKPVSFNDINLKYALLKNYGYDEKQELSKNDLKKLGGHLSLSNRWIKDLEGIQYCINIESIDLSNNQIENLAPLFELTNIQELYLDRTRVKDITGIGNLKNLARLDLSSNRLDDINEISKLQMIDTLRIDSNYISDLSPITNLKNLKILYAFDNEIVDLSPLSGLRELEVLSISHNNITDISSLANLKILKELDISSNKIQDVSSLNNLRSLERINLSNNLISTTDQILNISHLKANIRITNNPITNFEKSVYILEHTDTKEVGQILTSILQEKNTSYEEEENTIILKDYNKHIYYRKILNSVEINLEEITDLSLYRVLNRELWLRSMI